MILNIVTAKGHKNKKSSLATVSIRTISASSEVSTVAEKGHNTTGRATIQEMPQNKGYNTTKATKEVIGENGSDWQVQLLLFLKSQNNWKQLETTKTFPSTLTDEPNPGKLSKIMQSYLVFASC